MRFCNNTPFPKYRGVLPKYPLPLQRLFIEPKREVNEPLNSFNGAKKVINEPFYFFQFPLRLFSQ
jgi:hypothetical protein